MSATPTLRALPTPFDPPSGPTTVATPSCCCCCCCCLNALAAGAGFTVGAAAGTADARRRSGLLPILLSLLAVPLAGGVGWALSEIGWNPPVEVGVGAMAVTYAAVTALALRLAGAEWPRALLVALLVPVVAGGIFLVEIFAALFTVFIVELLAPGTFFLALHLGRKAHDDRPPAAASPWPPYPSPPPDAPALALGNHPVPPAVPPPPAAPELPWPEAAPPGDAPGDTAGDDR